MTSPTLTLPETAQAGIPATWEPSILVFACNWCSYAGADTAGVSRMAQQPNFRIIRTMCSGRIQPGFVLRAFEKGADGVLVSGCHIGDCHYQFGNHRALEQFKKTQDTIALLGIEPGRLRLEWISAAEGARFAQVVNEFTEQVRALGPGPYSAAKSAEITPAAPAESDSGTAERAGGGTGSAPGSGSGPATPAATVSDAVTTGSVPFALANGDCCTPARKRDTQTSAARTRAWACYDCGRCTGVCPLVRAGSPYSPRRQVLARVSGPDPEGVSDRALFDCLTCGRCSEQCPARVDYPQLVQLLRESARREGVEPECPHGGSLQSIMRMQARGTTTQDRLRWLDSTDLETEPERGEVFYFAGCAPYYDAFFPEYQMNALGGVKAAIKILNRLGIRPVVSGAERCCGHDLLWNGDRPGFEALKRQNLDLLKASGAKTLVTSCAECVRTWRLDYSPAGLRIVHISELIAENLDKLGLVPNGTRRITFHDPCRLGRHLGTYDAPRKALRGLPGVEVAEMRKSGPEALCCAGGTWSNCDKFAKGIQVDRLAQARSTGAEVMATACPKCQIHFRCAMRGRDAGTQIDGDGRQQVGGAPRIEMKDIGELVAEALV